MFNMQNEIDPGYLVFQGTLILNGKVYNNMYSTYLLDEGFQKDELETIKQYSDYLGKKKTGIEYKGTLITFTKEDTDGINYIYSVIKNDKVDVNETTFITSLKTSITLNNDNIDDFYNWYCINRNKFFITYEEFKVGVQNGIK